MNIYNFNYPVFIKDLLICNSFKKEIIKKETIKKINFLINKELGDFFKQICTETHHTNYQILETSIEKNKIINNYIYGANIFGFLYYIKSTKNSNCIKINNPAFPRLESEEILISPLNGRCVVFHGILPFSLLKNKDNKTIILKGSLKLIK
jgi:hypothetical protein